MSTSNHNISNLKIKIIALLAIIFISSIFVQTINAQEVITDSLALDSLSFYIADYDIASKKFDDSAIKDYLNSDIFLYDREPLTESFWEGIFNSILSFLDRIIPDFISDFFSRLFDLIAQILSQYQIIKYLLLFGALLLIIRFFLNKNLNQLFFQKSDKQFLDYESMEEDIHQMNFDQLIAEAIEEKKYRVAVRLLYLKSLKNLSDAQIINWAVDKTNDEYIREIKNNPLKNEFSNLSRQFDYIWYGEFQINTDYFQTLRQEFQSFNQSVNTK